MPPEEREPRLLQTRKAQALVGAIDGIINPREDNVGPHTAGREALR